MAAHAGLDREVILQVAVKLIDEHELGQLTIATLAAQLKVRPPTLYHYFDGLGASGVCWRSRVCARWPAAWDER